MNEEVKDEIARERIAALDRFVMSEIRRVEEQLKSQDRAVNLLGNANQIAQDKFEATVRDGFVKQNEFRGSLEDLGQTMATRRELETLLTQLGELRSRIDIGPPSLSVLQARSDTQTGRQEGAQQLTANTFAFLFVLVGFAGVIGHYLH